MCGIAGYVGKGNRQLLISMLDRIDYRGPDDRGVFIEGEVGLGNNRLSIIDLSPKGHQPMFNEDSSACIVYNGEIYNFEALRDKLKGKYKFRSHSDTEVILHAYEEWGVDCLRRLNGMFGFVIYDKKKKLLFGARDRLGEKPLKYYWDGKLFAFASEIKGLLPIFSGKPEADLQAINEFLTFGYVPAPKTGFKNIFKLPPASYFIFQNGKLKISKYWKIDFSQKLILSEKKWKDVVFEKIEESIKSRMISDVPVGAFLSGGIDSSTVVALMSQYSKTKIKTFSLGFDDSSFDESEHAKIVSDLYGTEHYSLIANAKMLEETLLGAFQFYDEPFSDNSLIPMLLLSKITGEKVKVALSGDGGDENFGGYERYKVVAFGEYYKNVPEILKKAIKIPAQSFKAGRVFANTYQLPFPQRYIHYNPFFERKEKNVKISTFDPKLSNLDNAFKFDITTYLPEDLLYKVDIASMAYSLEVRAPFLNHELIELTAQIPESLKIKNFKTKYIFKKILEDKKILPREIINKKKRGFVSPINKVLKQMNSSLIKEILSQEKFLKLQTSETGGDLFSRVSLSLWAEKYL